MATTTAPLQFSVRVQKVHRPSHFGAEVTPLVVSAISENASRFLLLVLFHCISRLFRTLYRRKNREREKKQRKKRGGR